MMIGGVSFFSFIMSNFAEIIADYNQKIGSKDQIVDLHNWTTLLTKFTKNKPLPLSLLNSIDSHFKHFWNNNRLTYVKRDNEYMQTLPRMIKKALMVNYLFKDIFFNFRNFFRTYENRDSKFLYEVSFGFIPR